MLYTAEAVSIGHPDKISDYISSFILDRMIEMDSSVKYAVEVMVKDNTVVLGGEITGHINMSKITEYVKQDVLTPKNMISSGAGIIITAVEANNGIVTINKDEITVPVGEPGSMNRANIWVE